MEWVLDFYSKQYLWGGLHTDPVGDDHRQKAGQVARQAGPGPKRVLELGCGGGQVAAAMAAEGHDVLAIDLVPEVAAYARQLAQTVRGGAMTVRNTDFYTVTLDGPFDVVCYWDGFGIGSDAEQRRLLQRVAGWLSPSGIALIEISTPWYAASVAGRGWTVGDAERRYSFDADGCRWVDTWWPTGRPDEAVSQTLRCYSPADLRLLLEGTGLVLVAVEAGGTVDWEAGKWLPSVPLERAMKYVASLRVDRG